MVAGSVGGMIFCAGLGTRLRPLSDLIPKPACPVLNRPLVAFGLALLKGVGVRAPVINTHHLADSMAAVATHAAVELGVELHLSREDALLGTGGGLAAAATWLRSGTFFLLNGDFLFDVDLQAALHAHRRSGAAATLVVQPPLPGYRSLHGTGDRQLACLPGQPPPAGSAAWHFTGVHVLEPAILDHLTATPSGIFESGYRGLLASGANVQLHQDLGRWHDIGTPEQLLAANLDGVAGRLPLGRYAPLGKLQGVDPSARIEGLVDESAIGPGAVIPAGARVRDSLVLAGTHLRSEERLERAIAAGELRLTFPA